MTTRKEHSTENKNVLKSRPIVVLVLAVLMLLVLPQLGSAQTTTTYSYDEIGRISRETITQGERRIIISYEYDRRSNLLKRITEITSSVDEETPKLTFAIVPNPTSSSVKIEATELIGETATVRIVSSDGRLVFEKTSHVGAGGSIAMELDASSSGLSSGSYTFTLTNGGHVQTGTLVITQ